MGDALESKGVVERRGRASRDRRGLEGDEAVGMSGTVREEEQSSFVRVLDWGGLLHV